MIITRSKSNIRTVKQGDSKFMLQDGLMICPRAGFEINQLCPREYKMIISECINNGWLKPVAHVYGKELTMDALR
jgi:hypothetical protein